MIETLKKGVQYDNMIRVHNKDTNGTPVTLFTITLLTWTHLTPLYSISEVNFRYVLVFWDS